MSGKRRYERPLSRRNNEFQADWAVWERENSGDNEEQLERVRRSLRQVRRRELTPRQEEMLHLYYDLGLSVSQIAVEKGVDKSTVSRTLARGRERLKRYLQYSW